MKIFVTEEKNIFMLQMDFFAVKQMMRLLALEICEITTDKGGALSLYISPEVYARLEDKGECVSYMKSAEIFNMAPHGHLNLWWQKVNMLHDLSQYVHPNTLETMDKVLIMKSLNLAKEWKERLIREEQRLKGEGWGSATAWNKFNPAEFAEKW